VSGEGPTQGGAGSQDLPLWRRLAIMGGSGFATISLLLIVAIVAFLWAYQGAGPAARQDGTTTVILPPHSRVGEIATDLEHAGVIRSSTVFGIAARINGAGRRLKAGEYEFPSHASMAVVMDMIRKGEIVHHMITIPEGYTSEEAVQILTDSPLLTGAAPVPAEGALLPETYEVRRGEDRGAVLQRMITARDTLVQTLWAQRQQGLPFQSPEQAMVLASIVEKETGTAAERPHIAGIFVNRLEKGIKLQSDPTIIYGLTRGVPLGHGIRQSELDSDTPYNTYKIYGLPPTPICNPGRAAIAAVLDPMKTNDLFFVASGAGGHAASSFSSSLDEHNKNVEHLRQAERQAPVGTH
jgi:UPF0755 protein